MEVTPDATKRFGFLHAGCQFLAYGVKSFDNMEVVNMVSDKSIGTKLVFRTGTSGRICELNKMYWNGKTWKKVAVYDKTLKKFVVVK